ncbi:hypothetical protein Nepgr_004571 [Nepenthes gracilis]|uniref:Proteasome assembly chaperone 2 n=1 Tax=Nepenthes gracilis TaxID=150966 RepID=A0AAD3S1L1_NEPGR|nr:hypothetical protein Nepgr_004571 [Nepenthes gracilis]
MNWIWPDQASINGPTCFLRNFLNCPRRLSLPRVQLRSAVDVRAKCERREEKRVRDTMEFLVEEGKKVHGECSTLILPALSTGNVGQLAVDLLISSTRAERVGYLDDPYVLPCVGNDAYGPLPEGTLSLPLEVYESALNRVSFVQQRSPVLKGMMVEFAKNLADFAAGTGKTHMVVLSSLDFGRWKKVDMSSGLQIHYLSSTCTDGKDDDCESLGWKKLQEYNPVQRRWKYLSSVAEGKHLKEEDLPLDDDLEEDDEDYYASLPFAALYSCFKAKGLKVTCLLCYCSEGDNIPDSINLAEAACKLLHLCPRSFHGNEDGGWVIPLSWKTVYGPPPDVSLF